MSLGSALRTPKARSLAIGLFAATLAFTWQALTVHYNYGGNWTALFCTGEYVPVPPQLEAEGIYIFRGSTGYDGQFYHYMAHDPFLRRGVSKYMDAARLRYRRILVPATAYVLAAGRDRFVDTALFGVVWLTVFLGAYWLSRYAHLSGRHPAWGLAFLLVPATIVAIDRTVVDATLVALVLGFAYYARRAGGVDPDDASWKLYMVLACAALTRETGFLLVAGCCLHFLLRGHLKRAFVFATAIAPALAWQLFAALRTSGDIEGGLIQPPGDTFLHLLVLRVNRYDLPNPLADLMTLLDYVMIAGLLLGMGMALRHFFRGPRQPEASAGLAYCVLMIPTTFLITMNDPFTYARVASPLLVLVALPGIRQRRWLGFVPVLLVTLRTAAQLAPQALGILRHVFGA